MRLTQYQNTLSQCIIKLNNEVKSIDDLQINQEEFEDLFLKQFQSNLSYYASDVEVSFAYYNVLTKQDVITRILRVMVFKQNCYKCYPHD